MSFSELTCAWKCLGYIVSSETMGIWMSTGLNYRLVDEISNSNSPGLGYIVSNETMGRGTHAQEKKKKKLDCH
jgi:hypothetical protein